MAITLDDIILYKSQDMTTNPDSGGGFMGTEIVVDGEARNVHGPISRMDRLRGNIDAKKVWVDVRSTDTESYDDSHTVCHGPFDRQVSLLLFPATAYGDHLQDLIDYIEQHFVVAQPAGSAGLDEETRAGEQMLRFVLAHREYTPYYDASGNPVWTTKVDGRWTLDVAMNELLYIGTEGGNGEFVQVQRLEYHVEELKDADEIHFYFKKYMIATLASPLLHTHARGEIPRRTDRNPAWRCCGAMELAEEVVPESNTLPVISTAARIAPVMTRSSRVIEQRVYDAPGYATNVVVERAGSSVIVPMTPQHQISVPVPVSGSFYTVSNLPDSVTGSVEIHYPSGGNWYTARENVASGNLEGEGSGTVSRTAGTGIALSCSQPPDAGAHLIIFLTRAHGFEVHSKSEILGNVESDSTPIGSHDEVGPGEMVWQVAATEGNTGEGFVIPGGATGAMTLTLSRPLIPEMPLEVWLKSGNAFSRVLRLAARGATALSATASGFSGSANYGARQLAVAGPITGDSLHVVYKSGEERTHLLSGAYTPPVPGTRVVVPTGQQNLVPGSIQVGIDATWKLYVNGAWQSIRVQTKYCDVNKDGVLFPKNGPTGQDLYVTPLLALAGYVDYSAGTVILESGAGYVTSNVILTTSLVWGIPYQGLNADGSAVGYYHEFADNNPFAPAGQVPASADLSPHKITPGTLKLYEGNSAVGPWSQIGADNGSGMVATSKGNGTLSYTDALLALSWIEPGYTKYLKAAFTEERHIIDYATRFVAALDFGATDLIPGCVAGTYQTDGGSWQFRDNRDGELVLVRKGLTWNKNNTVFESYAGSLLGVANGFLFVWSGRIFQGINYGLYMSTDGYSYQRRVLPAPVTDNEYDYFARVVFDGTRYFVLQSIYQGSSVPNIFKVYRLPADFGSAEEMGLPDTVIDIAVSKHGLLAITPSGMYRSVDGGDTWGLVQTPSGLNRIHCAGDTVVLLGASACHWSVNLTTWNGINLPATPKVVAYDDQRKTWLVGAGKKVYRSTDMVGWNAAAYDFHNCDVTQMAATNGRIIAGVCVAYGGPSYVVESMDGGVTWHDIKSTILNWPSWSDEVYVMAGEGIWTLGVRTSNTNSVSFFGAVDQIMTQEEALVTTVGCITDYAAGLGVITAGPAPTTARVDIALRNTQVTKFADFTRGGAPVTPGSYLLTAKALDGSMLTAVGRDASLDLGGDATGFYDPELGLAVGEFTKPFDPASVLRSFNYKASFKPSSSGGVNTTSLPLNGLVPVVRRENIVVISDRQRYRLAGAVDDASVTLTLADSRGWPPELPAPCIVTIGEERLRVTAREEETLTVERGADTTAAAPHDKGAVVTLVTYTEEMNVAHTVTVTKVFTVNNLTHRFSAGAEVLSALEHGDSLQAAVTSYHTQASWDGATWFDAGEYTGDPAAGTFDYVNYPIRVDNRGAMTDRWLAKVKSLSPLTLEVRGERHGVVIAAANATADIVALNPRGGQLFLIPAQIWGAGGHQVGNVCRWNTRGTEKPYWSVRVVNAQASDATDDGCVHETRGDAAV